MPFTFVVDGKGKVVWMGNPARETRRAGEKVVTSATFEIAIQQAVAGTSDLQSARDAQAKMHNEIIEGKKTQKQMAAANNAMQEGDFVKALAEIDRLIAADPKQARRLFIFRISALVHLNESKALTLLKEKARDPAYRKELGTHDEEDYWQQVSLVLSQQEGLSKNAHEIIVTHLDKMVAEDQTQPAFVWESLARSHAELGHFPQAAAAQQKFIDTATGYPKAAVVKARETLANYKKGKR